jgi:DNA-binding transcriptional ArsR family regulator
LRLSRVTALILVFVITVSFAGLILKQKNAVSQRLTSQTASESAIANGTPHNLLSFPISPNHFLVFLTRSASQVSFAETPALSLNNATRAEIYDFVKANPGVQFRAICSQLGISIGLAQFHLGILTKAGLVSFFRDGKYKRFFLSNCFSRKQMRIISVFRHETAGTILKALLDRKEISHGDLAHELSITSQGLTWQMNRLKKNHLVVERKENKKLLYSIECTNAPVLAVMAKLIEKP